MDGNNSVDLWAFWVNMIVAAATALSALGTLIAALYTGKAAKQAKLAVQEASKSSTRREFASRKFATLKFLTTWMKTYLRLPNKIAKMKANRQSSTLDAGLEEKLRDLQIELFFVWESLAAGINSRVFELVTLDQMTGSRLLDQYATHADFIRWRRWEESLRYYDQLDIVINRLLEMRFAQHYISDATIQRLEEAHVDLETIRRLRSLTPRVFDSDKHLRLELINHGLEKEGNLIAEYSRFPCLSIVKYSDSFKDSLEKLATLVEPLEKWVFMEAHSLQKYVVLWQSPPETCKRSWFPALQAEPKPIGFYALQHLELIAQTTTGLKTWDERLYKNWQNLAHNAFPTGNRKTEYTAKNLVLVERFAIHPDFQKKGIGRYLLRHVIRAIQEIGFSAADGNQSSSKKKTALACGVVPKRSDAAIKLCEIEGGVLIGSYESENGEDMQMYLF